MRSRCIDFTSSRKINMSMEMDSVASIFYMTWKFLPLDAAFAYFGDFFAAHVQFLPY